jgi:uncharacterized protein (TIGR00255 family)
MLLSMTGYGEARHQGDPLTVAIEVRAVNNRFLKVVVRASEPYNLLEPEIERVVRSRVRRGTVQIHLRCERAADACDFRLNDVALKSYLDQLRRVAVEARVADDQLAAMATGLLFLPGVAPEPGLLAFDHDQEWPLIEKVLGEALGRLQSMRREEGARMTEELLLYHGQITHELNQIRNRAPAVVEEYRGRLLERVRSLLAESSATVTAADLIKEVAIFAERSDVAEEVVRLASHLDQFADVIRREDDGPGRKLEFLVQEMGRETNTIGAKAGDVMISRHVVAIKATLEKIRELIQNVE